jgi:hypothetical protein
MQMTGDEGGHFRSRDELHVQGSRRPCDPIVL